MNKASFLAGCMAMMLCLSWFFQVSRSTQRSSQGSRSESPAAGGIPKASALNLRGSHPSSRTGIDGDVPVCLNRLQEMAARDPLEAINALDQLISDPEGLELKQALAWLVDAPSQAAAWIESLPDGPLRNNVVEKLLSQSAGGNPKGALVTAETVIDPELRDSAISSVLRRWAADDPRDALTTMAGRGDARESPRLGRAFLAAVTGHPAQLAEFLALLPLKSIDKSFLGAAAEVMLAKDPKILTLWSETIQEPEYRSAIAEGVVFQSGRNNSEMAWIWATQLAEKERRQEVLRSLLQQALNRDSSAANALLDSPWISREDRGVLIAFEKNWLQK